MTPKNSISLGRAFGIPIYLSRFLVLLVALGMFVALLNGFPPLVVLFNVTLLMGIVLLHELGHSLTARHFGVNVSHITLWPLGGVAWMDELPRDSRIEGLVAVAGPAVNLALATLAAPLLLFGGPLAPLATSFIAINLMLGLFNLIPAFPMDGGRVLRAFLARRGDWLGATERAVSIGKGFAFVLGVGGLLTGNFMLPFIAVFLWGMAQRELFAVRVREMGTAWPFAGFAAAAGQPAREAWSSARPEPPSSDGAYAARRPDVEPAARPTPGQRGGFSEADIRQLESYRGRLQRDWGQE